MEDLRIGKEFDLEGFETAEYTNQEKADLMEALELKRVEFALAEAEAWKSAGEFVFSI